MNSVASTAFEALKCKYSCIQRGLIPEDILLKYLKDYSINDNNNNNNQQQSLLKKTKRIFSPQTSLSDTLYASRWHVIDSLLDRGIQVLIRGEEGEEGEEKKEEKEEKEHKEREEEFKQNHYDINTQLISVSEKKRQDKKEKTGKCKIQVVFLGGGMDLRGLHLARKYGPNKNKNIELNIVEIDQPPIIETKTGLIELLLGLEKNNQHTHTKTISSRLLPTNFHLRACDLCNLESLQNTFYGLDQQSRSKVGKNDNTKEKEKDEQEQEEQGEEGEGQEREGEGKEEEICGTIIVLESVLGYMPLQRSKALLLWCQRMFPTSILIIFDAHVNTCSALQHTLCKSKYKNNNNNNKHSNNNRNNDKDNRDNMKEKDLDLSSDFYSDIMLQYYQKRRAPLLSASLFSELSELQNFLLSQCHYSSATFFPLYQAIQMWPKNESKLDHKNDCESERENNKEKEKDKNNENENERESEGEGESAGDGEGEGEEENQCRDNKSSEKKRKSISNNGKKRSTEPADLHLLLHHYCVGMAISRQRTGEGDPLGGETRKEKEKDVNQDRDKNGDNDRDDNRDYNGDGNRKEEEAEERDPVLIANFLSLPGSSSSLSSFSTGGHELREGRKNLSSFTLDLRKVQTNSFSRNKTNLEDILAIQELCKKNKYMTKQMQQCSGIRKFMKNTLALENLMMKDIKEDDEEEEEKVKKGRRRRRRESQGSRGSRGKGVDKSRGIKSWLSLFMVSNNNDYHHDNEDEKSLSKNFDVNYSCELWVLEDEEFQVKACIGLKSYLHATIKTNNNSDDNNSHHHISTPTSISTSVSTSTFTSTSNNPKQKGHPSSAHPWSNWDIFDSQEEETEEAKPYKNEGDNKKKEIEIDFDIDKDRNRDTYRDTEKDADRDTVKGIESDKTEKEKEIEKGKDEDEEVEASIAFVYIGEVCRLFVDEALQRQGIAKKLLHFIEGRSSQVAKAKHHKVLAHLKSSSSPFFSSSFNLKVRYLHAMVAVTVDSLQPALQLYQKRLGYHTIDEEKEKQKPRKRQKEKEKEKPDEKEKDEEKDKEKDVNEDVHEDEKGKPLIRVQNKTSPSHNRTFKGNGKLVVLGKILERNSIYK